jgi:hypothetical protein
MKERVLFQTNVPVTVALAYPDGINVEGRYGDQVMYTLTDERVMYVPPIVRSKLAESGIGKNEPFSICKAERREGNRRFIEWIVNRVESEAATAHAPWQNNGHEMSAGCCMPGSSGVAKPNGKSNGARPAAINGGTTASASLHAALAASIDAALEAERYASEHGLSVRFGSEDLRAMALSLFIQHARDGGVR